MWAARCMDISVWVSALVWAGVGGGGGTDVVDKGESEHRNGYRHHRFGPLGDDPTWLTHTPFHEVDRARTEMPRLETGKEPGEGVGKDTGGIMGELWVAKVPRGAISLEDQLNSASIKEMDTKRRKYKKPRTLPRKYNLHKTGRHQADSSGSSGSDSRCGCGSDVRARLRNTTRYVDRTLGLLQVTHERVADLAERVRYQRGALTHRAELVEKQVAQLQVLHAEVDVQRARQERLAVDHKWLEFSVQLQNNMSLGIKQDVRHLSRNVAGLYADHGRLYGALEPLRAATASARAAVGAMEARAGALEADLWVVRLRLTATNTSAPDPGGGGPDCAARLNHQQLQLDQLSVGFERLQDELGVYSQHLGTIGARVKVVTKATEHMEAHGDVTCRHDRLVLLEGEVRMLRRLLFEHLGITDPRKDENTKTNESSSTAENTHDSYPDGVISEKNSIIEYAAQGRDDDDAVTITLVTTQPTSSVVPTRKAGGNGKQRHHSGRPLRVQTGVTPSTRTRSPPSTTNPHPTHTTSFRPHRPTVLFTRAPSELVSLETTPRVEYATGVEALHGRVPQPTPHPSAPGVVVQPSESDICALPGLQIGAPRPLVRLHKKPRGSWQRDPESRFNQIYASTDQRPGVVLVYKDTMALKTNNASATYKLAFRCAPPGHVIYNGSLYCNRQASNRLVKFDLTSGETTSKRLYHASVGGSTPQSKNYNIGVATDEAGLWALYSMGEPSGNLTLSKINPRTLDETRTWVLPHVRRQSDIVVMICGKCLVASYVTSRSMAVSYAYDTGRNALFGAGIGLKIRQLSDKVMSMRYNPKDSKLYSWGQSKQSDGLLLNHPVYFKG